MEMQKSALKVQKAPTRKLQAVSFAILIGSALFALSLLHLTSSFKDFVPALQTDAKVQSVSAITKTLHADVLHVQEQGV